jgi:hypothetical protein
MTLAYVPEQHLRPNRLGPLDYDSPVPGQILASVMRVQDATTNGTPRPLQR